MHVDSWVSRDVLGFSSGICMHAALHRRGCTEHGAVTVCSDAHLASVFIGTHMLVCTCALGPSHAVRCDGWPAHGGLEVRAAFCCSVLLAAYMQDTAVHPLGRVCAGHSHLGRGTQAQGRWLYWLEGAPHCRLLHSNLLFGLPRVFLQLHVYLSRLCMCGITPAFCDYEHRPLPLEVCACGGGWGSRCTAVHDRTRRHVVTR